MNETEHIFRSMLIDKANGRNKVTRQDKERKRVLETEERGVNCCVAERKHTPYPPVKNSSADQRRETHTLTHP